MEFMKDEIRDITELIATEMDWNKNWKEYYPTLGKILDRIEKGG